MKLLKASRASATERFYSAWVKERQQKLEAEVKEASSCRHDGSDPREMDRVTRMISSGM